MPELKPEVIYIRGVHSTTGNDQISDIGFPQLGLENLFENAITKQIGANEPYSSTKKYVYKKNNSYHSIKDIFHFDCIKNGYYVLPANENTSELDDIKSYYTEDNNGNYIFHEVPTIDKDAWEKKLAFSNNIKNSTLYSFTPLGGQIDKKKVHIKENGNYKYYDKDNTSGNYYIKTGQKIYSMLEEIQNAWSKEYKCTSKKVYDENGTPYFIWPWTCKDSAFSTENGYYFYVLQNTINNNYELGLFNLTFNENNECTNITGLSTDAILYKLNNFNSNALYIVKGTKLTKFDIINTLQNITIVNEFNTNIKAFTKYNGTWLYPNISPPNHINLITSNGDYQLYSLETFPLYSTEIQKYEIDKAIIGPYHIYEKTAETINYNYRNTSNVLQIIFTDKDKNGILEDCNLKPMHLNGLNISKYVHLTNLSYII